MLKGETINWINGAPLGVSLRNIDYIAPHAHEDKIEITLCLSGEIKFSYCFEEFTLKEGDFILVDRDTHYLYDGKDAICASFYLNTAYFEDKYPHIRNRMFVCEGTSGSTVPHDTYDHKYLKSMLIAILVYMASHDEKEEKNYTDKLQNASNNIVEMLINRFDIIFWYNPDLLIKKDAMNRYRSMSDYLFTHHTEKVTVSDLAREFGLSKAYVSEFMSELTIGFRRLLGYVRVCHSEMLLMNTDMNMVDISESCGFSDPKYFYEYFRYWYGCTPREFKKKYLNEMNNENVERFLDVDEVRVDVERLTRLHFTDMFL